MHNIGIVLEDLDSVVNKTKIGFVNITSLLRDMGYKQKT